LKIVFSYATRPVAVKTLASITNGQTATVVAVMGPRTFRRRLMEMGLVPNTVVKVVRVAPLGDPIQIEVRNGQWSLRRNEAAEIEVKP
jgi:ferrous iron transport protein A